MYQMHVSKHRGPHLSGFVGAVKTQDGPDRNNFANDPLTEKLSLARMRAMQLESIPKGLCALCCCQRRAQVSSGMEKAGSLS